MSFWAGDSGCHIGFSGVHIYYLSQVFVTCWQYYKRSTTEIDESENFEFEKDFFIIHYGFSLKKIHRNENKLITEIYNWKILNLIFSEVTQNTSHIFFYSSYPGTFKFITDSYIAMQNPWRFFFILSCVVKHEKLQGSVSKQKIFTFFSL